MTPDPPLLCPDHGPVIESLSEKDHVTDRESERVAKSIARACPQCCTLNGRTLL